MPQFPVCGNFWPVWLIELTYMSAIFFHLYITLCSKRRMNMPCIYACCIQYKSIYAPLPQSQQKIHWLVIFPQDSYHMYIYILTYLCTCIWLEDPFYDVFRFFLPDLMSSFSPFVHATCNIWNHFHIFALDTSALVCSTTYNMYVCSCTCMHASDNNIYLYLLSIYWQSKKHVLNRVCFVLSAVALLLKKKSRTKQTKSTPGKITITWETTITVALWIWFFQKTQTTLNH